MKPYASVDVDKIICKVCGKEAPRFSDQNICGDCYPGFMQNYIIERENVIEKWHAENPLPLASCLDCGVMFNPFIWSNYGVCELCGDCANYNVHIVPNHPLTEKRAFVYFAHKDGLVKIGYSKNVKQRMSILGAELFKTLDVADPERVEKYFHMMFNIQRVKGEWFALNDDAIDWIQTLDCNNDVIIDRDGDLIWGLRKAE